MTTTTTTQPEAPREAGSRTLADIADEKEIAHLLSGGLIEPRHISEAPTAVREISAKETEIEFRDGLVVTLYDAVEPTAEWRATEGRE